MAKPDLPIAVLRIPKIHLEVPVFNGTDSLTLDRGAGRVIGTAEIGQRGNMAIAAHRDGFFRRRKDIVPGDILQRDSLDCCPRDLPGSERNVTAQIPRPRR